MKIGFFASVFLTLVTTLSFSQMDKVWKLISENNYTDAQIELTNLQTSPNTVVDASCVSILLNELTGKEEKSRFRMVDIINNTKDVSPYLFAFYYTSAVADGIRVNSKSRMAYLEQLIEDPKTNESYALAKHYVLTHDLKKKSEYYQKMGAITNWQYTGVFDNTSGSGYDKAHDPISQPEPTAFFYSKRNAEIKWFVPGERDDDPWITFINNLSTNQGVTFAQTFIENPVEREVQLALGGEGAIKLWVNDKLIIAEPEEYRTELDYYNAVVKLPKGNNRILIQLSHTQKSNYQNFLLRILDPKTSKPLEDLVVNPVHSAYNSPESVVKVKEIPHFAETYFQDKIAKDSSNIVDYIMLARCYSRARKTNLAIEILELGLKLDEENVLLNVELLENYIKIDDRTALMLQLEYLRKINPDLLFLKLYDFSVAKDNENYDQAAELMVGFKDDLGERSAEYLNYQIEMHSILKEYQELFTVIEEAYDLYPNEIKFLELKYLVEKNKSQSIVKALPYLKKYNKKIYSYEIRNLMIKEYQEIGEKEKAKKMIQESIDYFPDEVEYLNSLLLLEYNLENYNEALRIINKMISIAPFNSGYYGNKAYILLALGDVDAAMENFRLAVQYNPNSFESREKLRMLKEKDSWTTILENKDAYDIIEDSFKEEYEGDEQYDYVFYEHSMVRFEEGAGVEFTSMGIRILNKSGIEAWKEISIPTNYYSDNLVIFKGEINKSNGQKLEGERNYNQIVFPTLEVGDIIYLEFRKDVYTGGKLAKEMTEVHNFSHFVPTHNSLFRIYTPKSYRVQINEQNLDASAKKKEFEFEEFNCTEYRHKFIPKTKEENFMPELSEIGQTLFITTMESWETISDWYADLAMPMAREDYNLNKVYNEIFSGKENLTDREKAESIYAYLCDNINYSSVSFRQSNFVPQKPMVTISTKLGDCKDLSTLFYTLAQKADLKTNLVLVNTRENGENTMKIPSVNFNHCIIRIEMDGDTLYQELTDSKLPFGTQPDYLYNAQALVIPNSEDSKVGKDLIHIPLLRLHENVIDRTVKVKITDEEMALSTNVNLQGQTVSDYRWHFADLSKVETKESVDDYCSGYFESDIKVKNYELKNLDGFTNDFAIEVDMTLEDELKSIGSLQTFSIPFFEKIFSIDQFPSDERNHPLNYWLYEAIDQYKTKVNITIDPMYVFEEIPSNVSIQNKFISFTITVNKISETEIEVIREVTPNTATVSKEDYPEFRKMVKEVSKSEEIFVAFKEK